VKETYHDSDAYDAFRPRFDRCSRRGATGAGGRNRRDGCALDDVYGIESGRRAQREIGRIRRYDVRIVDCGRLVSQFVELDAGNHEGNVSIRRRGSRRHAGVPWMRAKMGSMLMGMSSLNLTSEQRQKIEGVMHEASMKMMTDVDAVLAAARRAELTAMMRQMASSGP